MDKSYHVCLSTTSMSCILTKSKRELSRFMGVSVSTVTRLIHNTLEQEVVFYKGYYLTKRIEPHIQRKGGSRSHTRLKYQDMISKASKMVSEQLDFERNQTTI